MERPVMLPLLPSPLLLLLVAVICRLSASSAQGKLRYKLSLVVWLIDIAAHDSSNSRNSCRGQPQRHVPPVEVAVNLRCSARPRYT